MYGHDLCVDSLCLVRCQQVYGSENILQSYEAIGVELKNKVEGMIAFC